MRTKLIVTLMIVAFAAVMFSMAVAEDAKHEFVGTKKCKMCHKKDGIFESWSASKHATAWDNLSDADKKNKDLAKYYTTGTDAKGVALNNIQCEACHGAGADYKKKSIMKDQAKAVAAGMVIPTAELCLGCHNDKAPAAVAAVAKDFDFAKAVAKGAHAKAKKAEAKK